MLPEPDVLNKFYNHVSRTESLKSLDIPTSEVFFIRHAIENATGVRYSLEHVEIALFLEGYLDPDKYFLSGLPEWYKVRYEYNFNRDELRELYQKRILASEEHEVPETGLEGLPPIPF